MIEHADKRLLRAMIAGDLGDESCEIIEAHVAGCAQCFALYEMELSTTDNDVPEPAPDEAGRARLVETINASVTAAAEPIWSWIREGLGPDWHHAIDAVRTAFGDGLASRRVPDPRGLPATRQVALRALMACTPEDAGPVRTALTLAVDDEDAGLHLLRSALPGAIEPGRPRPSRLRPVRSAAVAAQIAAQLRRAVPQRGVDPGATARSAGAAPVVLSTLGAASTGTAVSALSGAALASASGAGIVAGAAAASWLGGPVFGLAGTVAAGVYGAARAAVRGTQSLLVGGVAGAAGTGMAIATALEEADPHIAVDLGGIMLVLEVKANDGDLLIDAKAEDGQGQKDKLGGILIELRRIDGASTRPLAQGKGKTDRSGIASLTVPWPPKGIAEPKKLRVRVKHLGYCFTADIDLDP